MKKRLSKIYWATKHGNGPQNVGYIGKKKDFKGARKKARELCIEAIEYDDPYVPNITARLLKGGFGITHLESKKIAEDTMDEIYNELFIE